MLGRRARDQAEGRARDGVIDGTASSSRPPLVCPTARPSRRPSVPSRAARGSRAIREFVEAFQTGTPADLNVFCLKIKGSWAGMEPRSVDGALGQGQGPPTAFAWHGASGRAKGDAQSWRLGLKDTPPCAPCCAATLGT
jgi:hypothetical protein